MAGNMLAGLLLLAACAHVPPKVEAYRTAMIVNGVVTEAHHLAWSVTFRERMAKCEREAESAKAEKLKVFDDCLGPYSEANQAKVEDAAEAYYVVMRIVGAAISADKDVAAQLPELLRAADAVFSAIPGSEKWVSRLHTLVGAK